MPAPKLIRKWQAALPDHAISLGWSPDGKMVAAAAVSGPVHIFDAESGERRHELPGHGFGTTAVAWQPNGTILASAGQDGKIRLWDATAGKELASLAGGAAWVEKLSWSPAGDYLATGAGKKLRLWKPDGTLVREYPPLTSTVADTAWRPGSTDLTSASYGNVSVWIPEGDLAKRVFEWKGSVLALAWSPDGKYIATGNQDATVHFWIYKNGQDLQMYGYLMKVRELAWDPTSRYLATGGGNLVTVWDVSGKGPEGSKPLQLIAHDDDAMVSVLAYQKAGPLLASGGTDGLLSLWQPGGAKRALATAKLDAGVTQVAWSPSEFRLVAGTEAGTVAMFST